HARQGAPAVPRAKGEKQPLTAERLREQLGRLGGTSFKLGELENRLEGGVMLPVSELNRLRRDAVSRLESLRAQPKRWTLRSSGFQVSSFKLTTGQPNRRTDQKPDTG